MQADYEEIRQALHTHPAINIQGVSGSPPDRYQIEFKVRSLTETAAGQIAERLEHLAEVYLTLGYPRQAPQCRMLTPVFHPNIAPHAICIGDHWAAGESLLNLIVRIGEMLAYQSYNTQSPLNGSAARWVDENVAHVPTDPRDLSPNVWSDIQRAAPKEGECQNCRSAKGTLVRCVNGHAACPDCVVTCSSCSQTLCLLCKPHTCPVCGAFVCKACSRTCPQCARVTCKAHVETCALCDNSGCPDCIIECSTCGRHVCLDHVRQCTACRRVVCVEHGAACSACNKALCEEHARVCPECGKPSCGSHFDDAAGRCRGCIAPPQPAAPELIEFACPRCGAKLRAAATHKGARAKCPTCGGECVVGG